MNLTATIEEMATEHAESFINGNRKYVIQEIAKLPTGEAVAVAARVTQKLSIRDILTGDWTEDTSGTFVRLTASLATE